MPNTIHLTTAFLAGAVAYYIVTEHLAKNPNANHSTHLPNSPNTIQSGIESTIGNTPLILIKSLSDATGCQILAKCEFLNGAGGSPKDRVALSIINAAEASGDLKPGGTIYEGTVGSTGISLATLARARGYKAHICMPSDVAREKSELLEKLGAVVERVSPAPIVDQAHFVNRARNLAKASGGVFADQFETDANWRAHYEGTGPEIWSGAGGVDVFVAGAGTGGTVAGCAMYLKEQGDVKVVLADPQGSGAYNKIKHGVMFHGKEREGTRRRQQVDSVVEGIGLTRSTRNFDIGVDLIDDAVKVSDEQARAMARWLCAKDGIFVGSSSAVNCFAAVIVAKELGPGHKVVTILCDSGMRHLSKFWKDTDLSGVDEMTLDDLLAT